MILFKKASALTTYLLQQKTYGRTIGFVPTMGALHHGHLSLLEKAKEEKQLSVVSIFVNPTQFNNPDDFKHYPVTIDKDVALLTASGCHILFLPELSEIYPDNYTAPVYALGHLEQILEGHYRPGHFQGVCQVVERLLRIVNPDFLFLGQKDYQQCMVIDALLKTTGMDNAVQLQIGQTLREEDGLAMSSRNLRLTPEQRAQAPAIYRALRFVKENVTTRSLIDLKETVQKQLTKDGFAVDYFEIADADTLLPATHKTGRLVALVAASLGAVRLIDNLPLN